MQDEEITYALAQNPDVRLAAAEIADRIALKFARQANIAVGDTRVWYSDRAKQYQAMAKELRVQSTMRVAVPYAGGISESDKQTYEDDTDRVAPAFRRDLHDVPSTTDDGEAV